MLKEFGVRTRFLILPRDNSIQHIEQLHDHCYREKVCRIRKELWLWVRKEVKITNNAPTNWEAVRPLMRATWNPLSALLTTSTTLSASGATVKIAFSTVFTRSLIGELGGDTGGGVTSTSAVKELTGGVGMETLRRMEPLRLTAPDVSSSLPAGALFL